MKKLKYDNMEDLELYKILESLQEDKGIEKVNKFYHLIATEFQDLITNDKVTYHIDDRALKNEFNQENMEKCTLNEFKVNDPQVIEIYNNMLNNDKLIFIKKEGK